MKQAKWLEMRLCRLGVVGCGSDCGQEETRGRSPRLPWAGDGVKGLGLVTGVDERQCPHLGVRDRGVEPG